MDSDRQGADVLVQPEPLQSSGSVRVTIDRASVGTHQESATLYGWPRPVSNRVFVVLMFVKRLIH